MVTPIRLHRSTLQPAWPWTEASRARDMIRRGKHHKGWEGAAAKNDELAIAAELPCSGVSPGIVLLAVAMIEAALADLRPRQLRVVTLDPRAKRRSVYMSDPVTARAWIDASGDAPASFAWACSVVGLDPTAVRRRVIPSDPPPA